MEFLGRLEAFLMNSNVQTLSLDLVGSFEQSLYKDLNVSAPSYIELSLLQLIFCLLCNLVSKSQSGADKEGAYHTAGKCFLSVFLSF